MTPGCDDVLGMAWWNGLTEKERRRWMREAGDTGRAVDAWNAFKAAPAPARKLTPKEVLVDLLGEEPFEIADPQIAALVILGRLRDAGFAVVPAPAPSVTEAELVKFIYSVADDPASTASAARTAQAILQRYRLVTPA